MSDTEVTTPAPTSATPTCPTRRWCVDEGNDHDAGYHGSRLHELGELELAPGSTSRWYCWLSEQVDGGRGARLMLEGEFAGGRSAVTEIVDMPVRDVVSLLTLFRDASVVAKLDGLLDQVDQ